MAEALTTNKHLEELIFTGNALRDVGIQHLAHVLRVNQGLKTLELVSCGMTDMGLKCLAKSLQQNNILTQLQVSKLSGSPNRITENIVPVLTECLQNNNTLTKLILPRNLASSITSIKKAVNDVRKRSGLPLIEAKGILKIPPEYKKVGIDHHYNLAHLSTFYSRSLNDGLLVHYSCFCMLTTFKDAFCFLVV